MVSFRALLTSALALTPVVAQTNTITSGQVVVNIDLLTKKSKALQGPAQSINLISGPLIIIGQGPFPALIVGFTDIVVTATGAIASMQGMAPVAPGAASDAIFEAFRTFIRVHQDLLKILIGKAGLFQTVPFIGAPIAAVLRAVEGVVDTVAFALVDSVQSRADDLMAEAGSLKATLSISIDAYDGLSLGKKRDVPRTLKLARREMVAAVA